MFHGMENGLRIIKDKIPGQWDLNADGDFGRKKGFQGRLILAKVFFSIEYPHVI